MSSSDEDEGSSFEECLPSWSHVLRQHPIFPWNRSCTPSSSHTALPPSPSLQPISGHSRDVSDLSSVSSFTGGSPRKTSKSQQAKGKTEVSSGRGLAGRNVMAVVRDGELLLAVGSELRIASIAQVKANVEAHAEQGSAFSSATLGQAGHIGDYKILDLPEVTFPILSIVPSPYNPKLVALVGLSQLVVMVLPRRKEWSTCTSGTTDKVECRRSSVGEFFHAPSSTPISSVRWHPLGYKGSSLCVLTRDAIMREYDLNTDADNPVATLDFKQSNLSKSTSRSSFSSNKNSNISRISISSFGSPSTKGSPSKYSPRRGMASLSLNDPDSDEDLDEADAEAAALCFGGNDQAWGPFSLYCLMTTGDLYVASPFLPHSASISTKHIEQLREHLAVPGEQVQDPDSTFTISPSKSASITTSPAAKFVAALQEQASRFAALAPRNASMADESLDKSASLDSNTRSNVKVTRNLLPKTLPRLRRQGPLLLQPAPRELPGAFTSNASDLLHVRYQPNRSNEETAGTGAFLVAYSDGKVDVLLEMEPVEPRFEAQGPGEPPCLLTYETIDLGLSSTLAAEQGITEADLEAVLDHNVPIFTQDPIYPDVVYIAHVFGVHSLCFQPWLGPLSAALHAGDERSAEKTLTHGLSTRVSSELITMPMSKQPLPVAGLALVTDIYLGYTLLMLTSFYQLIAKDRSLLPDDTEEEENQRVIEDKPLTTDEKQGEAYVSLLDPPAFNLPSPFNQPTHAMSGPRFALPPDLATRKGVTVTPEALRFLGRTIETLRKSMHELNAAHGTVQQRFDVQIKELSRQLGKLAQLHDSALDEQDRSESFSERILQAQERQKELLSRSDRILQRLLDSRQPELSTVEKAWFEELDHLQGQVAGDGQLGTLKSRVEKVSSQVRVLKQHSEKLQGGASPEVSKMGKSQLQRVEALLGIEGQTLEHAKQKVESLQGRLDEVRDLQKH